MACVCRFEYMIPHSLHTRLVSNLFIGSLQYKAIHSNFICEWELNLIFANWFCFWVVRMASVVSPSGKELSFVKVVKLNTGNSDLRNCSMPKTDLIMPEVINDDGRHVFKLPKILNMQNSKSTREAHWDLFCLCPPPPRSVDVLTFAPQMR